MSSSTTRRILLFGSDGLRPDTIDPEIMPTYARLVAQATRLKSHRTVFPSITRAILSSISTGVTPGTHGTTSGTIRFDNATPNHIVDSSEIDQLRRLDEMTGGKAIQRATIAEYMEKAGVRMALASSQTTGGAAIWGRKVNYPIVNTSTTYGKEELQALWDQLGGPPPPVEDDNRIAQVEYACRAVAEIFVPDPSIQVIVAWIAEPDMTQHKGGLGSDLVRRSLEANERGLASIIKSMEDHGVIDDFDILLVSDHGHATVKPYGTLNEILERARRELGASMPEISHTSNNIYAMPNQAAPTAQELAPLITWLQNEPWVGALFGGTDEISALPGMLSLKDTWNGTYGDRAPLIALTGAWTDDTNEHGVPGTVHLPRSKEGPPYATHGNLSPYELGAFAAFVGQSFHQDRDIETPTGSTDLLPTILHLLNVDVPENLDGRVLTETFVGTEALPEVQAREVTPHTPHTDGFEPVLKLWQVGHTSYIDRCLNARHVE